MGQCLEPRPKLKHILPKCTASLFSGMLFKIDEAKEDEFNKMHVRVKPELVNFRLEEDVNPKEMTGEYLEPNEFYERLQDPSKVVIDVRNDYEHNVGHFQGAIKPDIHNLRELPKWKISAFLLTTNLLKRNHSQSFEVINLQNFYKFIIYPQIIAYYIWNEL